MTSVVIHMQKPTVKYVGPDWPDPPKPGSGSWEAVQEAVNWLLLNEEYWASYLGEFNRCITRDIPTAAVSYQGGDLQMLINPDYINWGLLDTMAKRAGPLIHEMLHPAMGHLSGDLPPGELGNICADLSVNSNMEPRFRSEFHLHPTNFHVDGKPLPAGRGWKFYWDALVDTDVLDLDVLKGAIDGVPIYGNEERGTEPGSVIQHASEEALKNAASKVDNSEVPSIIKKMLDIKFTQSPPPWDKFLASSCRSVLSKGGKRTLAKRGRRTRRPPGQENSGKKTVLWGLDTSGSMSEEDCLKCQVVMDGLRKKDGVKVLSQQFDAKLQGELTEVHKFKRIPTTFFGRGGTDFGPIVRLAKEIKPDLLVLATDGYAPSPPRPPCPVIWVFTPNCSSDHPFGKKIFIKHKMKSDEDEW